LLFIVLFVLLCRVIVCTLAVVLVIVVVAGCSYIVVGVGV